MPRWSGCDPALDHIFSVHKTPVKPWRCMWKCVFQAYPRANNWTAPVQSHVVELVACCNCRALQHCHWQFLGLVALGWEARDLELHYFGSRDAARLLGCSRVWLIHPLAFLVAFSFWYLSFYRLFSIIRWPQKKKSGKERPVSAE